MPLSLTPEEREAIKSQKGLADAGVVGAQRSASAFEGAAVSQKKADAAIRKLLNHFDDIILRYDDEVRWLNGKVISNPMTLQLTSVAGPNTGNGSVTLIYEKDAYPETFTLSATNPTTFTVRGELSGDVGIATVGENFISKVVDLKIMPGSVSFVAGDSFTLTHELLNFINEVPGNRLFNNSAAVGSMESLVPLRISQFDRSPVTVVGTAYELATYGTPLPYYDYLYLGMALTSRNNLVLTSSLNASTTSIAVSSSSVITALPVGSKIAVEGPSEIAFAEVTGFTDTTPPASGGSCSNPTYLTQGACTAGGGVWSPAAITTWTATIGIKWISPPSSTYPSSSLIARLGAFSGFSNQERIDKLATNSKYQHCMKYFTSVLVTWLATRRIYLQNQLDAFMLNPDDHKSATSELSLKSAISAINTFFGSSPVWGALVSTADISDNGITTMKQSEVDRQAYAAGRESEIAAVISDRHYTDVRFKTADIRFNLGNGTAKVLLSLLKSRDASRQGAVAAQTLSSKFQGVLNSF